MNHRHLPEPPRPWPVSRRREAERARRRLAAALSRIRRADLAPVRPNAIKTAHTGGRR